MLKLRLEATKVVARVGLFAAEYYEDRRIQSWTDRRSSEVKDKDGKAIYPG